jgi:hypothetical protein
VATFCVIQHVRAVSRNRHAESRRNNDVAENIHQEPLAAPPHPVVATLTGTKEIGAQASAS